MKDDGCCQLRRLKKLTEDLESIGCLPSYYLKSDIEWIEDCIETLFETTPFQKEDKVKLIKDINFDKTPGWRYHQHWLQPGIIGIVKKINFFNKKFRFGIVWDDECWIQSLSRIKIKTAPKNRHVFVLTTEFLKKEE